MGTIVLAWHWSTKQHPRQPRSNTTTAPLLVAATALLATPWSARGSMAYVSRSCAPSSTVPAFAVRLSMLKAGATVGSRRLSSAADCVGDAAEPSAVALGGARTGWRQHAGVGRCALSMSSCSWGRQQWGTGLGAGMGTEHSLGGGPRLVGQR